MSLFVIFYCLGMLLLTLMFEIGCFAWIAFILHITNHSRFPTINTKFWTYIFDFIKQSDNKIHKNDENIRLAVVNHFLCQRKINYDETLETYLQGMYKQ